jgi:hypothetical protein
MFKKIQYVYLLKKYTKWGVWRVAVPKDQMKMPAHGIMSRNNPRLYPTER